MPKKNKAVEKRNRLCFENKMLSFNYSVNDLVDLFRLRNLKKKLNIVGKNNDKRLSKTKA